MYGFLASGVRTCHQKFLRHWLTEFNVIWRMANTIWVLDAHQIILRSGSKWLPGGKIYDFLASGVRTCHQRFFRHSLLEVNVSLHMANTILVLDAH